MSDEIATIQRQSVKFFIGAKQIFENSEDVLHPDHTPTFINAILFESIHSKNDSQVLQATPDHIKRFPKEYEAFLKTEAYKQYIESEEEGKRYVSLEGCGILPAQCAMLKAAGVFSAQELVAVSDHQISHIKLYPKLRQKALDALKKADEAA